MTFRQSISRSRLSALKLGIGCLIQVSSPDNAQDHGFDRIPMVPKSEGRYGIYKYLPDLSLFYVKIICSFVVSLLLAERIAIRYWHKMLSVCLSSSSSVAQVYCDKTAEARIIHFLLKCSPMP